MNIFITGATGFIGSHVARRLVHEGHDVHILTRETSSTWRIDDILPKLTVHVGDVLDTGSLALAADKSAPDAIYHFANAGVYGGISKSPQELIEINAGGLLNLLEEFRSTEYRAFINVGSSSEYGIKDVPMREDQVCNPVTAYGISKLAATHIARVEALQHNKPIATFRVFSPYGPFDEPTRLIPQTIESFSREIEMILPNNSIVRDYICIDDVTDFFVAVAEKEILNGEVYNLGSGTQTKVIEVVTTIAQLLGKENLISRMEKSDGLAPTAESPCWVADMEKTTNAFAWQPKVPLSDGLARTVDWYKTQSKHGA